MIRTARARVRLKTLPRTVKAVRPFSFRPTSSTPSPFDWLPSSFSLSKLPIFRKPTNDNENAGWVPRVPFTGPTEAITDDNFDRLLPLEQVRNSLNFPATGTPLRLKDPRLDALFFGGNILKLLPEQDEREFLAAYHVERLEFVGDRIWSEVVSQVVFLLSPVTGSNLWFLHNETTRLCTNEMAAKLANEVGIDRYRGVRLDRDEAADRFEAYLAALLFSNGRQALLRFLVPFVQREFFCKVQFDSSFVECGKGRSSYDRAVIHIDVHRSISKGPILGQAETFNEAVTQFKTRLFKYNLNKSPRLCAELKVDGYQSTSGEGTNSHFAYVALISDARAKGLIKVDPNLAPRRNRFPLQYTSHAQLDALVITDFHFLANQKSIRFSHRWQFEPSGISPIKTFGPAIKTALIFRDLVRKCCLAGLLDVKDRESLKFEQGSRTSRTLPPPSNSKTPSSSPECASDSPPSPSPPTSPSGTSSSALPPEASLSPAENAPPSPTPVEPEPDQVDLEEETASTSSRTSQATLDDRSTTSSAPSSASEKIENRSSLEDWELVKARTQGWLFKSHHQALSRFTRSNLESAVSPPARFRYFIRSRIEANFFYSEGDSLDAIRDRIFAEAVERKLLEATAEGRKKFKKQVSRHPSEIGCVFRFDDENDVVRVTAPPHTKARKLWHHFFKECAARGIIRYPGSSQVKPSPIASSEVELVADITLTEPILSRPADSQLGSIVSTDSSEAASSMPSVSLSPLPSTDNKPETPLEDLACPKTPLDSAKKEEEDPTVEVISSNDTRLNPPSDPSFLDGFFPHDELPLDEANAEVGIQQSTESEVEEPSPNGSLNLNAESATRGLKEPSSRPPPLKIRLDAHALNQIEAQGGKFSCKIEVVLPGFETVSASTPRRKTTFEQIRDELIERGALTQDSSQPEQVQTLPFNTSMDGSGLFRTLRKYCQSNGGGKIKMHWTLEAPGHPRVSIGTGTTKGFKKSPSRLVRLAIEQGVIEYEGPAEQDIKKVEASASPSSRADPIQPDISPNSSNETLTGSSSDDTPSASSDSPISDSRNPSPSSDATSSNEPTAPSFPLSEKSQI